MNFDLNITWFILVWVLLGGYAILDGFDLGVGALSLFTKSDKNKRILLNAIGPVWDGNEVWLVTGGGALFAAFPDVYATLASGFYLAVILLLVCLIFRGVAIEFRSKEEWGWWRATWDITFGVSSTLIALLFGVVLGNLARGIPLDQAGDYTGTFWMLLNPFSILTGLLSVSAVCLQGALYTRLKTEGELYEQSKTWVKSTYRVFVVIYVLTTIILFLRYSGMTAFLRITPVLGLIPIITLATLIAIPVLHNKGKDLRAFLASCTMILSLLATFCCGIFPNMVRSFPLAENSLTIYNASSSPKTLFIMFIIAGGGMPVVIAYTSYIYWVFRGKVRLDETSY